jgi:hypothetical protein
VARKSTTQNLDTILGSLGDSGENLYGDLGYPPDLMTFIADPYYLGSQVEVEPQVAQLILEIGANDIREAFVQLGKGSGKSLVATVIPLYETCKMLHMRDPHSHFHLAKATLLAAINVSIGEKQAKNVIFKQIKDMVEKSPFFKSVNHKTKTVEIEFPDHNIAFICGHSRSTAFLGYGTFAAVLDEANYMIDTKGRSAAEDLYTALRGSLKTRFPSTYKLLAISSASTPTAWLTQQVNAIKRTGNIVALSENGVIPTYQRAVEKKSRADTSIDEILKGLI